MTLLVLLVTAACAFGFGALLFDLLTHRRKP